MFGHVGDALRQRMHLRDFPGELRPYRRLEITDLSDFNYECAGSPDHAVLVVGPNSRRSERFERAFLFRQLPDLQAVTIGGDPVNPLRHEHAIDLSSMSDKDLAELVRRGA
jgi:hypothetical protein